MQPRYFNENDLDSPKKPKILISMHPIDRCVCFEKLCDGILERTDCAICYHDSPSDGERTDFDGVDCVICCVTEKYITWNNSGFVSECLGAIKNNVPLIPVLFENDIENLFNTRIGKIHHIKNAGSRISDETLEQIAERIDELKSHAAQIPARFHKTEKPLIFISYRKCDSEQLKTIVNLINASKNAGKATVWYDESLKAGENFNDEIAEHIRDCNLFLMVITPNMLIPGNYVMRVEYPLAVRLKKHVIPVIAEKTDLKALNASFPKIPKCITCTQIESIFTKIKEV